MITQSIKGDFNTVVDMVIAEDDSTITKLREFKNTNPKPIQVAQI